LNEPSIAIADAGSTWDALAAFVDRFLQAWEADEAAPALASFLPAAPPALRRLVLVELIKIDLDYRWQRGQRKLIEDYLGEFPELAQPRLPCDLLYEEYHIRKRCGADGPPDDLLRRFPEHAEELGRLLGLPDRSMALVGTTALPALAAGERVDDFDLLLLLGEGAFAKVYLAWQRSMQRQVALKVSAPRGVEAKTLAQLDHDHIVRVYDQRVLAERNLQLLYMQPIAGGTLQHAIAHLRTVPPGQATGATLLAAIDEQVRKTGGTPSADRSRRQRWAALSWPEVVCWIGLRLADALDYAAARGVLHRDLKPANVLLTPEGEPLLTDFNISFGSKLEGANPAHFFGGSLAYMSPEQLDACNPRHPAGPELLDARSDIFSLGVVLWELLTGRRPFPEERLGPDGTANLTRLAEERRAGIAREAQPAACPETLVQVLTTSLAADPADRFPSGGEMARQLALCLNPRACELLAEPRDWRRWARRFPTTAVLLTALVPNFGAAVFNLAYNSEEIIGRLQNLEAAFWTIQLIINSIAFPLGILVLAAAVRPVARALARVRQAKDADKDGDVTPFERRRCLLLGHVTALVAVSAWLSAGLAFPASLAWVANGIPLAAVLHFLASLALCGLIAAVYPFFAVTLIAVRAFYPPLISPRRDEDWDFADLRRRLNIYLVLAATVPMLGIFVLVSAGSSSRFALVVLSVIGLAGFGLAFLCHRALAADLEALDEARRPVHELIHSDPGSRS
jgi:serine/threonine protein kinase